jgi:hypothetical protein
MDCIEVDNIIQGATSSRAPQKVQGLRLWLDMLVPARKGAGMLADAVK